MQFDLLNWRVFGVLQIRLYAIRTVLGGPCTIAAANGFHVAIKFAAARIRATEADIDDTTFARGWNSIGQHRVQCEEDELRHARDQFPAADHRSGSHCGAHQSIRAVDMDAIEKAVVDRDAVVYQAARDKSNRTFRHRSNTVDRAQALRGRSRRVKMHMAIFDRDLDL